ncbi:hypothetical protein [Actinomadura sp. 9N407]|uniref:hypothetical protein n=1 Tax=Actinomadura sp. 9N407 TaxID=3375154 RepID=UPI0037B6791F
MSTTAAEQQEAISHLEALAQIVSDRGFTAKVVQVRTSVTFLRVVNMDAGQLSEDVTIGSYDGEPVYVYSWGDVICPVRHLEAAGERLSHVLTPDVTAAK